jgi:predicted AlkP superfamily phosphohydrolase/phosphomutase
LERSVLMKSALARQLLQRNDLDHVFVVFAEAHKAGHFLWKYMDSSHPEHIFAGPRLRNALLRIYQLLDRQLAELSRELTDRDNLLIFSDHGMQANYRGDQFVAPILDRLGLCKGGLTAHQGLASPGPSHGADTNGGTPLTTSAGACRFARGLPSAFGTLLKEMAPHFITRPLRRYFGAAARIDWSQTQVFQLPTDRNSYLRVNLRGREPHGIVDRGMQYDQLLAAIESELRALVNVETGKPAVEAVFKVHELYPGPRVDDLPDMAILWSSDAPLNIVESPRLGRMEIRVREGRSGNHRAEGFLLARGPDIQQHVTGLQGDVLQIPPTLCALHGIRVPDHYAMAPLKDLLAKRTDFAEVPLQTAQQRRSNQR